MYARGGWPVARRASQTHAQAARASRLETLTGDVNIRIVYRVGKLFAHSGYDLSRL